MWDNLLDISITIQYVKNKRLADLQETELCNSDDAQSG